VHVSHRIDPDAADHDPRNDVGLGGEAHGASFRWAGEVSVGVRPSDDKCRTSRRSRHADRAKGTFGPAWRVMPSVD
jgi:hypothetical protein